MSAQVIHGDCLDVLRTMPDESVHAIVTDPPYGLTQGKKGGTGTASVNLSSPAGRSRISTGTGAGGFMGMKWDHDVPSEEIWRECLRVLKPGGYLLAFAGTRTQHRMAVRIEDAGFEIRDMIAWVYASGFPKSLDVGKAIDKAAGAVREVVGQRDVGPDMRGDNYGRDGGERMVADVTAPATPEAQQWDGWGTALKPALEPITVARKPLMGTVADNVLAHGTGALNIHGCRVDLPDGESKQGGFGNAKVGMATTGHGDGVAAGVEWQTSTEGRWPANLIHDGSEAVAAQFTVTASDGAARFFYCAKASQEDRDEGLGKMRRKRAGGMSATLDGSMLTGAGNPRTTMRANTHPTVKPTDLMRYLVRLVTPPGGMVLDPFCGSGSTGKAALLEGLDFIGIEREAEYVEIARARLAAVPPHLFAGLM